MNLFDPELPLKTEKMTNISQNCFEWPKMTTYFKSPNNVSSIDHAPSAEYARENA